MISHSFKTRLETQFCLHTLRSGQQVLPAPTRLALEVRGNARGQEGAGRLKFVVARLVPLELRRNCNLCLPLYIPKESVSDVHATDLGGDTSDEQEPSGQRRRRNLRSVHPRVCQISILSVQVMNRVPKDNSPHEKRAQSPSYRCQ